MLFLLDSNQPVFSVVSALFDDLLSNLNRIVRNARGGSSAAPASSRQIKPSTAYHVSFTLLNADPRSHLVTWDVENSIDGYLAYFFNAVSEASTFHIDSQILQYANLSVKPSDLKNRWVLPESQFPYMINPNWNLGMLLR